MNHPIYRVTSVEQVGPYVLCVGFDDSTKRTIDFEAVLEGDLLSPLRDKTIFAQVKIDPEVRTLVWPSGADFDPATLHDWPEHEQEFKAAAKRWRDLEDRGELAAAKKRNAGKPGTPLREAAKELGWKPGHKFKPKRDAMMKK